MATTLRGYLLHVTRKRVCAIIRDNLQKGWYIGTTQEEKEQERIVHAPIIISSDLFFLFFLW